MNKHTPNETTPAAGPQPARDRDGSVPRRRILRDIAMGGVAVAAGAAVGGAGASGRASAHAGGTGAAPTPGGAPLLCEPYLLDPVCGGVHVVWHTEQRGGAQVVLVGAAVAGMSEQQAVDAATGGAWTGDGWRRHPAGSVVAGRTREDAASQVPGRTYDAVTARPVWRHLARVTDLPRGRTPYRVVSVDGAGLATVTAAYSLAPALPGDASARLLLSSDHQLKTMTPANLDKVAATVGVDLDGVLFAGDMVNVADRPSEWFDSTTGLGFFAGFTGRGSKTIAGRTYRGAPILQHTPIFPAIGNHEVMGRWSATVPLNEQFNDPQPTAVAARRWEQAGLPSAGRDAWVTDHSWNVESYEHMFPVPRSPEGGPRWYARTVGDVHVTVLFATGVWRPSAITDRGKFTEAPAALGDTEAWGYGQFIFEPVTKGSPQYAWLERELRSQRARQARYRVVVFHHPAHGLGDNSAPAFTDPVQTVVRDPGTGAVTAVTYAYPLADDGILRDVEPLFAASGVDLVHNGHSHVWNRFRSPSGVNWLETSNVGNTYGAFDVSSGRFRSVPADPNHVLQGDPGRLPPVVPTIAPLTDAAGNPLPYLSSSDITCFSVLDSGSGTVRSYRFDTRLPDSDVVLFDEFPLGGR